MAIVEFYNHILLRGLGEASKQFQAFGRGSTDRPSPVMDRGKHAAALREQIEIALADMDECVAAQKAAKVPLSKRGAPITVIARPNESLVVGEARSLTNGLKLFNVRRARSNELNANDADQATFFLNKAFRKSFEKNLDLYSNWIDDGDLHVDDDNESSADDVQKRRHPRNFWLFESASLIRASTLRDFWTDAVDRFPRSTDKTTWEVWTRRGFQDAFFNAVKKNGVECVGTTTEFVETVVGNVIASPEELQRVMQASAAIVELRSASSFVSDFFDMDTAEKSKALGAIARRITGPAPDSPRVAILDTGVNRAHPLLAGSLPLARCHAVEPNWGMSDHQGHGTKMAGIAQFGDLAELASSNGPIVLRTELESVVVTAPHPAGDVPARDAIKKAVEIVEVETRRRVFCLAQTAEGEAEDGRPTSTSAVLDLLAYGNGSDTRLFCAAAGNVPQTPSEPYQIVDYEDRNARFGIQSPAQALNALSVGAVSLKGRDSSDLLAPVGDLMPSSRTAVRWSKPHATKPDIVMEGGNFLVDELHLYARPSPAHFVMTTSRMAPQQPLAMSGETSTATALAAGLAARVLARYPDFRMETIRGLMVHSAEWTPAMDALRQRLIRSGCSVSEAWSEIFNRFGWGVPNEGRLFSSASNSMTLIAEDELFPYEMTMKDGKPDGIRLKQMKYFKLPWPREILRSLGKTEAEMRCTLSYFVEPDPHAASRDRFGERYPSHRLRFDVKRFGEGDNHAQQRFNRLAPADATVGSPDDEGWLIGSPNQRGTLLQNIWRGPAYRLADRDGVSVVPIRGWWGDMHNIDNYRRAVHFSLIVSVRIPDGGGNLMAEVSNKVPAGVVVQPIIATV